MGTLVRTVCDCVQSQAYEVGHFIDVKYFYYSTYALLLLNGIGDDRNIGRLTELPVIAENLRQITTKISEFCHRRWDNTACLQRLYQNLPISRSETFFDISRVRFYFRSKLFTQMLNNGDRENLEIEESARGLYQLASHFKHFVTYDGIRLDGAEPEALFLSGLVLTRSRYPTGDLPQDHSKPVRKFLNSKSTASALTRIETHNTLPSGTVFDILGSSGYSCDVSRNIHDQS